MFLCPGRNAWRLSSWPFKNFIKDSPLMKVSVLQRGKSSRSYSRAPDGGDHETSPKNTSTGISPFMIPEEFSNIICLPLRERPYFPMFHKDIIVEDPNVVAAIEESLRKGTTYVGVFLRKDLETQSNLIEKMGDVHQIGVVASVLDKSQTAPGSFLLYPHGRIKANGLIHGKPVSRISAKRVYDEPFEKQNPVIKAITQEIFSVLADVTRLNPFFKYHLSSFPVNASVLEDQSHLADFIATLHQGDAQELQEVLESLSIEDRLRKALVLLKKDLFNAQLQQSISQDIQKKMMGKQREFYLMEQLKAIKKKLGLDVDAKEKIIEGYKKKVATLKMPEAVSKIFEEELSRLSMLESSGSEFNVCRTYLDWIVQLPWGKETVDILDPVHASEILDHDHYGLNDVKERILEFIAVGKMHGKVQGKILCLVGPPGVGKTSIGKSIARALDREFFRFSVGGLTDVAELKGHRRTYVAAMPGKIVQGLKRVSSQNPLILIDEIDKIGKDHRGDPASALLEILDPEQNNAFLDHYLDFPMDLSKVLFICTANDASRIPGPLFDRMEVIRLSGYVHEEKFEIAKRYLIPVARSESGLTDAQVTVDDSAIHDTIRWYCRENGVRSLKKQVEKLYRKAAYKIVKDKAEKVQVTAANLKEFLGTPIFSSDRLYPETPTGVVTGLAWNSMGGCVLYIETVVEQHKTKKTDSKGELFVTGNLQNVMKESSSIAYSFAKSLLLQKEPENDFFSHARIHLHVPEGAIEKDGPSAGCTMATALISLATGKPVKSGFAMTGELSLTGKILRIGGLKEKIVAAKRAGLSDVICPKSNKSDWDELPDFIKNDINIHFVENYGEIFDLVFQP